MDTLSAFVRGQANRGKELMVFDWHRAAELIKENNATNASAGLASDWEYTGGPIYTDGEIDEGGYTYLASTWATPQICIDGAYFDCYKMQGETPGWDSDTKWPESAKEMLA